MEEVSNKARQNIAEGKLRTATANVELFGNNSLIEKLLDTSSDLIGIYELDGGHFVSITKSWTEVLGWNYEEFCSRPFIEFVHVDDKTRTAKAYKQMQSGNRFSEYLFTNRYQHKDGHYVELQWNVRKAEQYKGYAMAVARPVKNLIIDDKVEPSNIATIFLNGESTEEMVVGTEFSELFKGMICRDLAPLSDSMHLWQCVLDPNVDESMDWHRHPYQIEEIKMFRGELNMEVQKLTLLQWLGLEDRMLIKRTKKVTLKAGQNIRFSTKRWHRVRKSPKGANYTVEWQPKHYDK